MNHRRNGLRNQVIEAKEESLELRKDRGKENMPGGKGEERSRCAPWREPGWVLCFEGICLAVSGRIPVEYSLAFQMCSFRVLVSTDLSVPGQGSLITTAGPDVSHGVTCPVWLLFWAWS